MPTRIGRYRIRGELGRGGMGIVYDAYDPELDRHVALKRIDRGRFESTADATEFAARFAREMRATSGLFHPNVVSILDAGVDAGAAYYVMERVEGESLEQRLRRRGPLDRAEVLHVARGIAEGLAAAHERGLVHRDLKPSNVLLKNGDAVLVDFGLCHLLGAEEPAPADAVIVGSPHYLSPEQVQGGAVGRSADLFALGAILLRMVTGRDPFPAPDLRSHLDRITGDAPDGLEELDPELRELVRALMAKRPEARPASAAGVAAQLESLARSAPPRLPRGLSKHLGSRAAPWLAAAVVGVGLVASVLGARNELVSLDTAAEVQWRQVQNQLERQAELIPELVRIAERYSALESRHLERLLAVHIERARSGTGAAPGSAVDADGALVAAMLEAERLPRLAADRHFRALAHEVAGARNRIAVERGRYNESVGRLNRRLGQIPWRWLRGSLQPRPYFDPPAREPDDPLLRLGSTS